MQLGQWVDSSASTSAASITQPLWITLRSMLLLHRSTGTLSPLKTLARTMTTIASQSGCCWSLRVAALKAVSGTIGSRRTSIAPSAIASGRLLWRKHPIRTDTWHINAKRTGSRFGVIDSGYESLRYERMTKRGVRGGGRRTSGGLADGAGWESGREDMTHPQPSSGSAAWLDRPPFQLRQSGGHAQRF